MAPSAEVAKAILRDGSQFQWYVIPLFALVVKNPSFQIF
jgi:hypothetical protein